MFEIDFWKAGSGWTTLGTVSGCEAAYAAFEKACELAEIFDQDCALIDRETGEVLALTEIES